MAAGEQTPSPPAARARGVIDRVVSELAGDAGVVDVAALAGDAPNGADLAASLREHAEPDAVVACVGVLERLVDFGVVVEALVAIAAKHDATVVLSVPNAPYAGDADRVSAWGEGAVRELRRLLPPDHLVFHELALRGSALVADGESARPSVTVELAADGAAPVSYVLVFGPRAARLRPRADVHPADVRAEREVERALRAELEVLRARADR